MPETLCGVGIPRLRGGGLVPMLHGLEAHATRLCD